MVMVRSAETESCSRELREVAMKESQLRTGVAGIIGVGAAAAQSVRLASGKTVGVKDTIGSEQ